MSKQKGKPKARKRPTKPDPKVIARADRKRQATAARSRVVFAAVAEIGEIPAVVDPDRKDRCRNDLFQFLVTYFPESTGKHPFSEDHKNFIARLQSCILDGGRMIEAVYRGFGKTTIAELSTLWAALYGHKTFGVILGADHEAASNNLDSIKSELEANPLLLEDFPEACYPITQLEGRGQRTYSQTCGGERTLIGWTKHEIVLPTIPGSLSSGACMRTKGLLSCNRGMTHKAPDGRQIRPDWVFVDDPQTDQSAISPAQVDRRLSKLYHTVLRLAGHAAALSLFIAATVIATEDMAHQLLDNERHPSFAGTRVQMVDSWAQKTAHEKHWLGEYTRLRHDYDRENPDDRQRARAAATAYYTKHRKTMDKAAVISWDYCYSPDAGEISAVQHAYNILIDDGESVFKAECQNDPVENVGDAEPLSSGEITRKQSPYSVGIVPAEAERLTAFVDVQGTVLYWLVAAWTADFTGWIIDYGIHPKQGRRYTQLRQCKQTLRKRYSGTDEEGAIFAGLSELSDLIVGRLWKRPDGTETRVDKMLVDSGWNTSLVKSWTRQSKYGAIVQPSKGFGVRARDRPMSEWKPPKGCRRGREWMESRSVKEPVKSVNYDANYWKTQAFGALGLPLGNAGTIAVYKTRPANHQMLADHLTAERATRVWTTTRSVLEWSCPKRQDNHLGDCLVGTAVAASMLNVLRPGEAAPRKRARRRVTYH